jgi:hypothetical protein
LRCHQGFATVGEAFAQGKLNLIGRGAADLEVQGVAELNIEVIHDDAPMVDEVKRLALVAKETLNALR